MEKSWNFNHFFSEKKFLSCKNKQDRWKISRMAKNATKMRHFQAKNLKNFLGTQTLPPLGGKYP